MINARKIAAPILTTILLAVIGTAGWISLGHANANRAAHAVVTAHGIVGSEKQAFFEDKSVIEEFRKNGIDIQVSTQGSREQANNATKDGADFYFPAGEPAGRAIAQKLGVKDVGTPFYTPMVIASWKNIAQTLAGNGISEKNGKYWYIRHMDKMIDLTEKDVRWNQIPHNSGYDVGKTILISSTDVRKSNSADMYLALASYVENGNATVTNSDQARKIQEKMNALFLKQGFQESSSAGPFEDYVSIGEGKTPLVICYEQQYIEYLAATENSARNKDMVLLYPKPTIFTKHTIVPTDEIGRRVAQMLQDDTILRKAEIRHGFRNADVSATKEFWSQNGIDLPEQIQDVIDPPSFQTLETMIKGVENAYARQ